MDAHGSDLPSIHQRPYFDGIVQLPVLPSQSGPGVISSDAIFYMLDPATSAVANKYKKLKCEYRQGKEARTDTGNDGNEDESELWGILNSAFAGRTGIGGATLADADNDSDCVEEEKSFSSSNSRQKAATPIASLAAAMKDGMTAIAASMGTDDKLVEVLHDLRAAQEAARDLQARQLTLLEHLVSKMAPPN
ncbi:hypothetical protein AM587_10000733 [Phytophthora nicotianae]|uniref:Uncharacterized protein n=1 Tax=Phytophthora nicotianae TaxID=4792 RepID=A0A0W8CDX5_PHYNI|nr:hypothetical protein AM587_10000733 [Phytophthora nicotianae]